MTHYTMIDRTGLAATRPVLDLVTISLLFDADPDLSYLAQDYAEDDITPMEQARYQRQDRERLAAYRRGEWYMVGVRADAIILIPRGGSTWQLQTIRSGGLWGIESDSEPSYFTEVGADEAGELKQQLELLCVDLTTWPATLPEPKECFT